MTGLPRDDVNGIYSVLLLISVFFIAICVFFLVFFLGKHIKRDDIKVEQRKKRLNKSVKAFDVTEDSSQKSRNSSVLLDQIKKLSFTERLGVKLIDADILVKPEEFLLICFFAAVVLPLLLLLLFQNFALALIVMALAVGGPIFFIRSKKNKKIQMFNNQLADALLMMSNSLVAGLSFQQAMENIAREMPAPISTEFGRVVKEMRFGKTLDDALNGMIERVQSDDLMIAMNAVMIQHQVGGNLSEILETIAGTVKDRIQLKNEVKVITAQGKYSGIIIALLPIILALILSAVNPTYIAPLFSEPLGLVAVGIGVVMEVIGVILIKNIVTIEF